MRTEATPYLDLWTGGGLAVGLAVALVCLVAGLRGRPPGPVTLAATAVLQLTVAVVVAVFAVRTLGGDSPVGPVWELWAYLVTVLLLPAVAVAWAREEPTRWSTFVLAVAALVAAVMTARVGQIWAGVGMA
ncbi:MAG: hypothetical protein M3519_01620 [Actinomycetota bacterium]|nr:hypothetical protein [Actinomycetota bacterium]